MVVVQPKLKYASSAWDPYISKDIQTIERVQRIAARWVNLIITGNAVYLVCVLSYNAWPALHIQRQISQLAILYQRLHNLMALETSAYITVATTTTTHSTRFQHHFHFNIPTTRTNSYHNWYTFWKPFVIGIYYLAISIIKASIFKSIT